MKLVIIGAGPGGYETAVLAAKRGIEVTIISDGPLGGTCLNEGCIPTKALCRSAEVLETVRNSAAYGIDTAEWSFDFAKASARKEEVVGQLRSGVEFLLSGKGITLVRGKASIVDSGTVKVGDVEYHADYIIIATGSHAAVPPIPGIDLPGVLTSAEMLSLEEVPSRLCVIGAGVIGLEFASIFKSFGSEVSVLEYCKDILPRFDTDLAKRLKQSLSKRGISIETSASVQSISPAAGGGLEVSFLKKDKEFTVEADKVLVATGRRPNVDTLNLADAGIAFSPKGIVTDGQMRTSVPNIFAVGDVTGGIMLAHAATAQGIVALDAICDEAGLEHEKNNINLSVIPAAVFTVPEVATVGLTQEDCEERGIPYLSLKSMYRANGKAVSMGSPEGYCKILVARDDERILGCHIFGEHAADIIQEITALCSRGGSLSDLRGVIHAHPTLSEVVLSAARG